MKIRIPHLRHALLFAGLALLVIGIEATLVQSAVFGRQPDWISLGITLDLVVGLPVLFYYRVARRLKLPLRSLLSVFGLALALTALILPANHQQVASLLRRSLILIELGCLGYVLVRIRQIIRRYEQLRMTTVNFTENLRQSLDSVLGHSRFNRILVSELAVLRYGLFGWRISVEKTEGDIAFSSHRESGQVALTIGLIAVGLIETVGVHMLLNRWGPLVAWFATLAGFYGLLFIVADLVATIKSPVLIRSHQVVLRFGLRGYGVVDRQQIERVTPISNRPERAPGTLNGTFFTTPNVQIITREPIGITGLLGIRKSVNRIFLFIDDKQTFIHELTA